MCIRDRATTVQEEPAPAEVPVAVVTPTPTTTKNPNPTPTPVTPKPKPVPPVSSGYTLADVAGHKGSSDCWIIISSKVYNVTTFLGAHPGGRSVIASRCGTDVTEAFNGGIYNHSSYARTLLPQYYKGNLSV